MTVFGSMTKMDDEKIVDGHHENALHLVDRIKNSLTTPDSGNASHAGLLADISRLQLAIETPLETIYRIGHQVIDHLRFLYPYLDMVNIDMAERLRQDCS